MELIVYTNSTFTEEQALSVDGAVVLQGDYYHDKITDKINGFIACLDYLETPFTLSDIIFILPMICSRRLSSIIMRKRSVNMDSKDILSFKNGEELSYTGLAISPAPDMGKTIAVIGGVGARILAMYQRFFNKLVNQKL